MALVIISRKKNQQQWQQALQALDHDLEIQIFPTDMNRNDVDFALAWQPPLGVFNNYPNLKVIASTGAGVDHILQDPDLPPEVIITRVVDAQLTHDMTSYLVAQVYSYLRNLGEYNAWQRQEIWHPKRYKTEAQVRVGIMGMGVLGSDAALKFRQLGFRVHGWSRSAKEVAGIKIYAGLENIDRFLQQTDILICLLPLTPQTRNILNKETFATLPAGAFIVNVARGEHLVEEDLLAALDSGHLHGACLDVFREEPLPQDHPFWQHPKIIITPHIASITNPESVAPQVVDNYRRMKAGQPLRNVISRQSGY